MYYPSSKNKGADQLRSYCEADQRLCFSPMQIVGFPMRRLIHSFLSEAKIENFIGKKNDLFNI